MTIHIDELLGIRRSIADAGRELRHLINSNQEDLYQYLKPNKAGHQSLGIDLLAEQIVYDKLNSAKITGKIVSEESGEMLLDGEGETFITFILDPLDGSTNFRRGIPFNSISLAFMDTEREIRFSELRYGIVYDFHSKHMFELRDGRVFFNDHELMQREPSRPKTICYYYYHEGVNHLLELEQRMRVRTLGCCSLELVHVATGGFDAFIDVRGGLGTYDFAVGAKILQNVGGNVTFIDPSSNKIVPYDKVRLDDIEAGYKLIAAREKGFHEELVNWSLEIQLPNS